MNLPFLSDFYNWVTFDNLVLPDDKMQEMHRAFLGRPLDPAKEERVGFFGPGPARGRMRAAVATNPATPKNVALAGIGVETVTEADCERTTIALDLQNAGPAGSEFVTQIKIPEGVLVSGFWLKIGDERVAGRVIEQKSALWVYQMIRDRSRRDPALLMYSDPQSLELRVFPFAAAEQRRVEIQFLYPITLRPALKIGEREWQANGASGLTLALTGDHNSAVVLPPEASAGLPAAPRSPYLHFIIDRSADSRLTDEEITRTIGTAAQALGNPAECAISMANYETTDLAGGLVSIRDVTPEIIARHQALPQRGGFLAERAR